MRLLLSKKSREILFNFLKERYKGKNLIDLSDKMGVPFKTLKKWRYAELYLPDYIIPKEMKSLKILDKQDDNWGTIKGGKIGGRRSIEIQKKKFGEKKYQQIKSQIGKKAINVLWKKYGKELTRKCVRGKINKRESQSKKLELANSSFFINEIAYLDLKNVRFSRPDKFKKIKLPKKMSEELAEEIGVHMGDGCLSYNKNYFSVKCNKKEEKYFIDYLFKLYNHLYNLDLKLMRLSSVSGFEIYSRAIFEFKNKVIGLPYGEKVWRLNIPQPIIETKNRRIYCSFIRGLFDTDGCVYIRYKRYPIISITIKSKILINQLADMFKKLGFIPAVYNHTITLNGPTMLEKWLKEIGSNNPKNIDRLKKASSIVGQYMTLRF